MVNLYYGSLPWKELHIEYIVKCGWKSDENGMLSNQTVLVVPSPDHPMHIRDEF